MISLERLFPGNSELAGLMRSLDWSRTELGPPEAWPERLRSAVSICLLSRFPIVMWWGPKMSMLYNDAYISFLGRVKHPAMLACSFAEAWAEIWPTIGPMLEAVRTSGEASWSEDILMFFDRDLPNEEVYVTFSFSPLIGEGNEVDGIFCACTETTEKLVSNRRIESLRRLGMRALAAPTVDAACRASAEALADNALDVPFVGIYVIDEGKTRLTLRASAGLQEADSLPRTLLLTSEEQSVWPLAAVLQSHRAIDVELARLGLALPGGPWPEPAERALVLPIAGTSPSSIVGVLIAGLSPRRVLDVQYRTFLDLVAGHIGKAIAEAQVYQTERRRVEALAELDRAKTTFFSNVSHEFRTPLTLMLAPIEDTLANLSSWPLEAVRGQLETAHRNALRLLKLVNALLDFSRIEAARVQASFEPVDLAVVTAELASVFRAAVERAGLTFIIRCEPLREPVYVDREMWEKVVLNLLSNAFKFTFEGEIEVAQRVREDRVELTVRDTGIGVAPEDLPRLFDRFHRVEGAQARTYEGSGIGLSLVRELVRMHAGEIRADSEPGRGTRFTISLHRGVAHLPSDRIGAPRSLTSTGEGASLFIAEAQSWLPVPAEGAQPATPPITAVPGARILVADDNADTRQYLTRLLAERWVVESVPDGAAALARVREGPPFDLIMTDVMMPKLNGFGLLRALRADPTHAAIPVIMLSARAGEERKIEGLEAGADDYLVKPFSAREVVTRVETHLELAARRALVAENAALVRLHEVSGRLISEEVLPTLLEAIVDAAVTVADSGMGDVQLYDATTDSLAIVAQRGFDRAFLEYFSGVPAREGTCSKARRLLERVIVEDVSRSTPFLSETVAVLLAAGVQAVQSTPLLARDGRLLGVLSTHWTEPHRPDERTLQILDILTREAAALIEHRQREDALRRSEATVRELRAAESASAEREIRRYQQRIQEMAFDAIVTEERERRRIAADLHDTVGQYLAVSQMKLSAARHEVSGPARQAIEQVIALIGESITSARTLTFDLSPPILYDLGIKDALHWLAEQLEETYETRIEIADDERDKPLDDVTAGLVFRATRELLMNVVRHSSSPTAKVTLRRAEDRFAVTVEDAGVGFDPDDPSRRSKGFGLLSVREQILRLRGSMEVITSPGRGVQVAMSVPISARGQGIAAGGGSAAQAP